MGIDHFNIADKRKQKQISPLKFTYVHTYSQVTNRVDGSQSSFDLLIQVQQVVSLATRGCDYFKSNKTNL